MKKPKASIIYWIVLYLTYLYFRLFYRLEIKGTENLKTGGGILAANHVSYFDPPVVAISSPEPIHFLARGTLFKGVFGKLIQKLQAHPVGSNAQSLGAIRLVCNLLLEGKKVLIFPEGTRSETGELLPIRPGIGLIFLKTHQPIYPVYIEGTYSVFNRKRTKPKLFGKIRCVFGKPLQWQEYENLEKKELQEMLSKDLNRAFCELREYLTH